MCIPTTIKDSTAADQDVISSCSTHAVPQEVAADVHGSCNAGATASEVPGILLEVGLRHFLEAATRSLEASQMCSLHHPQFELHDVQFYMKVHAF